MNQQAAKSNAQQKEKPKPSGWNELINKILRPPRSSYKQKSLGRPQFMLNNTKYQRKDIKIGHANKQINLTLYKPQVYNRWLILYLHANSSSKLECTSIIKHLPAQISLASFDFIGCGLSQYQQNISLGVRQSQQVQTVVTHLQKQGWRIILWGRSMGAATALKYGKAAIIVADSSFSSFQRLCEQQVESNTPKYIPMCLVWCVFPCLFCKLRSDIQEKGNYDVDELNILKSIDKISPSTMIIYIAGEQDTLVNEKHSERLYNRFLGKKKYLQRFKGSHNQKRPDQTLIKVMSYLIQQLKIIHENQNKQTKPQQVQKPHVQQSELVNIEEINIEVQNREEQNIGQTKDNDEIAKH